MAIEMKFYRPIIEAILRILAELLAGRCNRRGDNLTQTRTKNHRVSRVLVQVEMGTQIWTTMRFIL